MTAAALHYPFPTPPAPGDLCPVAPGVFWLRLPLPFALDHINLWLLRDGAGWTLVDTGLGSATTQAQWEGILARLDGPVTRIVVTHFHPDHLGQAAWLAERCGAAVWMTAGEFLTAHAVWQEVGGHGPAAMVAQFRDHGLDAARQSVQLQRGNVFRKGVPHLPGTYRRLVDGERLDIDGQPWRVLVGHGHSPEHGALYAADANVLISGDMLLPRISTNVSVFAATPEDNALGRFLASLNKLEAAVGEDTLVLPSHGRPFIGVGPRVAALHEHHRERLAELEAACDTPHSAADLLPVLFPRELDAHQLMFAMGEAIAHLNYLDQAGRLVRTRGTDGVFRYCRSTN